MGIDGYDNCMLDVADMPLGEKEAPAGNSFSCREYHLRIAQIPGKTSDGLSNKAAHCPHADITGAEVCAEKVMLMLRYTSASRFRMRSLTTIVLPVPVLPETRIGVPCLSSTSARYAVCTDRKSKRLNSSHR